MSIGVGVFMLIVGLILLLGAVDLPSQVTQVVDTPLVGLILTIAGIAVLALAALIGRDGRFRNGDRRDSGYW